MGSDGKSFGDVRNYGADFCAGRKNDGAEVCRGRDVLGGVSKCATFGTTNVKAAISI